MKIDLLYDLKCWFNIFSTDEMAARRHHKIRITKPLISCGMACIIFVLLSLYYDKLSIYNGPIIRYWTKFERKKIKSSIATPFNSSRSSDAYMRQKHKPIPPLVRRQAVNWTLGIILSGIIIENSFKKMHLKMSSGKWWPFCFGLNVLSLGMNK